MKNGMTLAVFYEHLRHLRRNGWPTLIDHGRIRLVDSTSGKIYCPITAVAYLLTNESLDTYETGRAAALINLNGKNRWKIFCSTDNLVGKNFSKNCRQNLFKALR